MTAHSNFLSAFLGVLDNMTYRLVFSFMVLLAFSPGSLRAETLDQIGTFSSFTVGGLTNDLSLFDTNPAGLNVSTAYDNFTFSASAGPTVTSLSWVGAYEFDLPSDQPALDFRVNFYGDPLGAINGAFITSSAPLASFSLAPSDFTATSVGGGFINYTTTVTPFAVAAGTPYWVSIVAQLPFGGPFPAAGNGWGLAYSSVGGDNTSTLYNSLPGSFANGFDYAISISAVPEPGSLSAIFAVAGLVAVRRRRMVKKLI